jgi:2'-5' RNA ligase
MRLFLAITPSKEVRDHLFSLQKGVKDAKVAWVAKKNIHLTLKFLGDVDKTKLPQIKKKIQIKHKKIKATLGQLGFFPNKSNPRVIWVNIEPEKDILNLQQKIDETLLTMFPGEQKFKSHITIGRIKTIKRKKEFLQTITTKEIQPISFMIDSIQLIKSELTRSGPRYEVIANVSLS